MPFRPDGIEAVQDLLQELQTGLGGSLLLVRGNPDKG